MLQPNSKRVTAALAFVFVLSACQSETSSTPNASVPYNPTSERAREAALPESEESIPATLTSEGSKLASGMNAFGLDLYRVLAKEPGDLFFSPASISTAFGLTRAGAGGTTASEMAQVLHIPADLKDTNAAAQNVQASLSLNVRRRTLSVSNALWIQKDLALQPAYLDLVNKYYSAGLKRVDYVSDPKGSRDAINGWVLAQTHGRIRDLVHPDQITKLTKVHLINTAFFKAGWIAEFSPEVTQKEDFFFGDGSASKLPLMHQTSWFRHVAGDGMHTIALEYVGRETEMVILLPDKRDGLSALEGRLTSAWLNNWLKKLSQSEGDDVILTIPKFRLEQRRELVPALEGLGMKTAFTDYADFSAMRAQRDIKLTSVVHQVFLDVDEKGTEAAAATAIGADAAADASEPPPPKIFRADHPFLFLIRDQRTGVILFMGRFTGK